MGQENQAKDIPMICDTLAQLIDAELLTAKQLDDLWNLAERGSYRYISGQTEPTFSQIRTLFRHADNRVLQRVILADLTCGMPWTFFLIPNTAARDGHLDTSAVIDGTIAALHSTSDALNMARIAEKSGFPRMQEADARPLQEQLHQAMNRLAAASRAVEMLTVKEGVSP